MSSSGEPDSSSFLSPSHWRAVQAAGTGAYDPAAAPLASSLWRLGYLAFHEALVALPGPERESGLLRAESLWRRAVLHDPGQTDGWLGLVLIESSRHQEGPSADGCWRALTLCPARLKEEQLRYGHPLRLDYQLLFSCRLDVDVPGDLPPAQASRLMLLGRDEEAEAALAADPDLRHPPLLAAKASLALRARRFEEALPLCRRLALGDDGRFRADGLIGAGISLAHLGEHEEAEVSLQQALVAAGNQAARLAAHYGLSLLHRERDDAVRERAELEIIAAEAPEFADLPVRLAALRAADPETAIRDLEQSLKAPSADDPSIPDNRRDLRDP